jgi:hypothetical protein
MGGTGPGEACANPNPSFTGLGKRGGLGWRLPMA